MATTTFYPDAGTGNTTVDGYARRTGVSENWATIIAAAGVSANDTSDPTSIAGAVVEGGGTNFENLTRFIMTFDTSSIGSDTITSATLSIYGTTVTTTLGNRAFALVAATPANNNAVVAADFTTMGATRLASDITPSASQYNDWTLNASGRAHINKLGITAFGVMIENDFDGNTTGFTISAGNQNIWSGSTADHALTTQDPKLVVEHISFIPTITII